MKRTWTVTGWIMVSILALSSGGRADEKPKAEPLPVMRQKLSHAQGILEGVAVNDFKKIKDSSEMLIAASKKAAWQVLRTPEYELHSDEFRQAAKALIKAADKQESERAALAYVDMTLTCVKCHQHVRERGIGLRVPGPRDSAQPKVLVKRVDREGHQR